MQIRELIDCVKSIRKYIIYFWSEDIGIHWLFVCLNRLEKMHNEITNPIDLSDFKIPERRTQNQHFITLQESMTRRFNLLLDKFNNHGNS